MTNVTLPTSGTLSTATNLTGLSDVSSETPTADRILVAEGTDVESGGMRGDEVIDQDGAIVV